MLPITGHETRGAVPSNQTAARAPQREGEESFADTMQRAQAAPEEQEHATGDAETQSKPVDVANDDATPAAAAASAESEAKERPAPQESVASLLGLTVAPHGDVAQRGKVAAGKPSSVEAKHDKRPAANAGADGDAVPAAVAVLDGPIAAGAAETQAKVHTASDEVAGAASGGVVAKGIRKATTEGVARPVAAAPSEKKDVPQGAVADVASVVAGDDLAGKAAPHAALEIAKVEAAPVEKAAMPGGVAAVHVAARLDGGHVAKASVAATAGPSSSGPSVRAGGGDELSVTSYETSAGNRLEIGVAGGSWGWLKVRAEMGQGGEVHAFLRGATAVAESELRAQAGDLQMYLGAQQIGVREVHVEASRQFAWTGGAGMGDGERQAAAQREQVYGRPETVSKTMRGDLVEQWMPLPQGLHGAGGWLNVLA